MRVPVGDHVTEHNSPLSLIPLHCPSCCLRLEVLESMLCCGNGHSFPRRGTVIDFSMAGTIDKLQERTRQSFQSEWMEYYPHLGWTDAEWGRERAMFLGYTRSMGNFFSGRVVVDAGCGNGRYINVVNRLSSRRPKLVIGIELSDNVDLAARNCEAYDNVVLFKMDLNLLPRVLQEPVDYVYSIGVLHHTPSAGEAFAKLATCVKEGGFLSVFLYGRGNRLLYRVNSFLRNRFFQKWPRRLVYYLCVAVAVPCQAFKVPFLGPWALDFVTRFVFVSPDVHNMFDAYTAGFTSFHDKSEVEEWYKQAGFDCVVEERLNRTSLFCIGTRLESC